jgi:hypothetical protein
MTAETARRSEPSLMIVPHSISPGTLPAMTSQFAPWSRRDHA